MKLRVFTDEQRRSPNVAGGGWEFLDPDDGFEYKGEVLPGGKIRRYEGYEDLAEHIERYREEKGYEVWDSEELRIRVESYLCDSRSGVFVECCDAPRLERSLSERMSGARAFIKGIFNTKKALCLPAEAEERAIICRDCPSNKAMVRSPLQFKEEQLLLGWMRSQHRTTAQDKSLNRCEKCGCPMKSKVHFSMDRILEDLDDERYESLPRDELNLKGTKFSCWIERES